MGKNRSTGKPKRKSGNKATGRSAGKPKRNPAGSTMVRNTRLRDSGCKIIFENNILCAQFLRDYIDLPCMKDIRPEDIEDVSAQFVPLVAEERNADSVKRVNIRGEVPFFIISLIEHKTKIDYNVCMQIFRYMFLIWDSYEKDAEKVREGISRQKDFQYPPILPVVYYEGKAEWTVPRDFISRVKNGQSFREYMPDFRYYLVPLKDYSNKELMAKKDEISLVMMINKIQTAEDIAAFRLLPAGDIDAIVIDSPEHLVNIIADILLTFLLKINVPVSEAENLTDKVREKKVAELFADMEKMDIQAERRNTEEQKQRAEEQKQRAEEQKQRAEVAEQNLEAQMQKVETTIALLIESYRDAGLSREAVSRKIMEKLSLAEEEARSKVERYWL